MKILGLMFLAIAAPSWGFAAGRTIPSDSSTQALKIDFNQERLDAYCLVLDSRDVVEVREDEKAGCLKGPVTVFFQGHAQRPSDAYPFTSKLALQSKSGIVVIPVCDTPYGVDERWRGDAGKEVILMEIVRWSLALRGIGVKDYSPLNSHDAVRINDGYADDARCRIQTSLVAVGWSHGGILARRFAHSYPESVVSLGQVCPAGYEKMTPSRLTGRFAMESLRISKLTATGHACDTLKSAWGFTKGFVGDFSRSIPSAILYAHPEKICRTARDIRDCSIYCDSSNLGLPHLERIAVIFGADDSCMSAERIVGTHDPKSLSPEILAAFRGKYFADSLPSGENLSLRILPGSHLAPVSHSDIYAKTLLEDLGQLAGS